MKNKLLLSVMFLLLIVGLYMPASYCTNIVYNPHFTCTLANDVYTAPNVYQFDIYLLRTGTTSTDVFRYYAGQYDLSFNNSVLNGGTLTAAWAPESWDGATGTDDGSGPAHSLDWSFQYGSPIGVYNGEIRIAPAAAGGNSSCAWISNVAPGTRIGTVVLTNSVPFLGSPANFAFQFTGYSTKLAAYQNSTATNQTTIDVTVNGTFLYSANWQIHYFQ